MWNDLNATHDNPASITRTLTLVTEDRRPASVAPAFKLETLHDDCIEDIMDTYRAAWKIRVHVVKDLKRKAHTSNNDVVIFMTRNIIWIRKKWSKSASEL